MITAALIGLIISFLTGGHSSAFLTPNLLKRVKKSIKDPSKRKDVLENIKQANAAQARFDKRSKAYKKMLSTLTEERVVNRQEYINMFSALIKDHQLLQNKIISSRFDIIELIRPQEFALCIDKDFKPSEKSINKANKVLSTHLKQMNKTAKKIVTDEKAQNDISNAISDFNEKSSALIKAIGHMDVQDHEALGRYNATKKELKTITNELNEHRKELYSSFIDMHQSLAKSVSDKQWKAASKALKALIK